MHLKIRLKVVFTKDDLAVLLRVSLKMEGLVLILQELFCCMCHRRFNQLINW